MTGTNDLWLRALFARQREHDTLGATPFGILVAGTRRQARDERRRRMRRPVLAMLGVAAVVVAVVLLPRQPNERPPQKAPGIDLTSRVWRAPTDFLLESSESVLLRSVPTFNDPLPGMGPRTPARSTDTNTARKGGPQS